MNDLLAFNAGIVYCYDVLASSIAEVETGSWVAPDAAANDDFGIAVALDPTGTLLAIGADQSGASPGKVYIFSRTAGKYDWAYQQTVTLSGSSPNKTGTMNYYAQYIATGGPSTAGTVNTSVQYSMIYN